MPANLENSAVATGLEKVSFHSNPKERQKSKMAVWGGLTNSCEKKRSKKQRGKGKINASKCKVQKNSKER